MIPCLVELAENITVRLLALVTISSLVMGSLTMTPVQLPGWLPPLFQADARNSAQEQASDFELSVQGAVIDVQIEPGRLSVTRADITRWVRRAAAAVCAYYGHMPVPKIVVRITPSNDDGVGFATSTHEDDLGYGLIEVNLGQDANPGHLEKCWTLTHEMIHLTFPIVDGRHRWLAEGIATYVEPLARMKAGQIPVEAVWGDLVENLPSGLPSSGDAGLNGTRDWGRTYWGGALYCLLVDIQLRQETNNRYGLQDALQGITNAGGTAASDWSVADALRAGDRATGTNVLTRVYAQMAHQPVNVNLPVLWRHLGVRGNGADNLGFDNVAPLAPIRSAIDKRDM